MKYAIIAIMLLGSQIKANARILSKPCDSIMAIQPYVTTNENLTAVFVEVWCENPTTASIDAVWKLYDKDGGYVNDGRYQLGGDDFIAYLEDEKYIYAYVVAQKELTVIK